MLNSELNPESIASIIHTAADRLQSHYVFPDRGEQIAADLKAHVQQGRFQDCQTPEEFAKQVTAVLLEVSADRHIRMRYHPAGAPELNFDPPSPEVVKWLKEEQRLSNYGFYKVERLNGNVGYLDLRAFAAAAFAAETAIAAMQFLAHTDAVIIDLRNNGGGDPEMIQLISTYLFEEVTHLNNFYFRPADQTHQTWTLPYVPGKRLLHQPVYLLTSNYTFSAAEEFTYNLKNLKRATIVGETTGGGAHPGGSVKVHEHFTVFVPTGRAINPISGTNWEGTGVEPDVQLPADQAFDHAYQDALQKVLNQLPEHAVYEKQRQEIQEILQS
ncbi:S41 family peptidase [Deinococcus roseus]|uniref:Interphotoreceptor retinoid-binding protein n=1 Tax=Deinococcus roseus TaxID=392414 RepID=A0ABQ2CWS8_9DEIO|nr:S41 family peptidase [Deinococcus roseus]GGJ28512.1 interphotoreceptor retinoid-binding protein [Deinococcus roseus]